MSEPKRNQPYAPEPVRKESDTSVEGGLKAADDRGGFRDTAPNPHDERGAEQTAARATGAITGMFFPAVILAIIAIAVILYFAL
jgi:hypothetical protein